MKIFFPIFNLALAAALFFGLADPLINKPLEEKGVDQIAESTGGIRALQLRQTELSSARDEAQKLRETVITLRNQYNEFKPEDLSRLDKVLPDHVDNIQLIIDVNNIAKLNGMSIKNIKVSTEDDKGGVAADATGITSANDNLTLGKAFLSFETTGTYDMYKNFLKDLSRSLRLTDISSTAFASDQASSYNYNVELTTYWLK